MKTNKLQIVAIAMLMATMTSCEWELINPFMPVVYGMRSEPISMRVTGEELGFDNELFYMDSIYRQGDAYNSITRRVYQKVIEDNGKVDTVTMVEHQLSMLTEGVCRASSSDSIHLDFKMQFFLDKPWEIGYTHHFHIVENEDIAPPFGRFNDYVYVEIEKLRAGDIPQILSIGACNVEGWIRLTSFSDNSIPGHTDISGEFEITLTHREDPNKRIYIQNGTFENVAFYGRGVVGSAQ